MKKILWLILLISGFVQAQTLDFLTPPVQTYETWNYSKAIPVTVSETWLTVTIAKEAAMQADYDDLRFVEDINGTTQEKQFLPYWIETSDGSSATVHVGFKTAPTISDSFYVLYGNDDASAYSNGYKTAVQSGWYYNDFSRGVNYDIVNVLGGYDQLLAGDANGEETWPAGWQDPNDPLHCGVIYKRQDTNLHAGNPTTRTAQIITTDGWDNTWGSETVIDDPGSSYNSTSSTSNSIPTSHPTSVVFTIEAGKPWVLGDVGQARSSDITAYFDFTVVSYSGTTLTVNSNAHTGTGTFTSWVISDRIGATNATITAVELPDNAGTRLIMLNSHVDYSLSTGTSRVGTKYSDDWGTSWSTWEQRTPNQWNNVGGQAITMANGWVILASHQNVGFDGMTESTLRFYISRDYGITWEDYSVQLAGVQLDEVGMFQKKSTVTWDWVSNKVKVICRVESSPFHYYTFDLTVDLTSTSNTTPVENNFYVDEQSRGTYTWVDNRVIGFFGDVRGQGVYSDDSGDTWKPIPYTTLEGNLYSSRRLYQIMYYFGNGKTAVIWSNNKLSGGADLYINYWDAYLMALRPVANATLTDARTRPTDLAPGVRVNGSLVSGYRGTSTTSVAIPTSHPTTVNFTTQTGLSWTASQAGTIANTANPALRFTYTVDSYNSGNGAMQVSSVSNTGTGTLASWDLDLTSNFLVDQAFVSTWNKNGGVTPFKAKIQSKNPNNGFFGIGKAETRATAVITITNAGSAGDIITIKWATSSSYGGLFTGIGKVAEYTVQSGDNIAAVVNGLVASANSIGTCLVSASDATTLTLFASRGESSFINGLSFDVDVTGTVAGSSGTFSGGAVAESVSAVQNVIIAHKGTDLVHIEQADDNYTVAFSNSDNSTHTYDITWNSPTAVTDGITTATKTSGQGSGIPNWWGRLFLHVTTNATTINNYNETYLMRAYPVSTSVGTVGSATPGTWISNSINNGIQ